MLLLLIFIHGHYLFAYVQAGNSISSKYQYNDHKLDADEVCVPYANSIETIARTLRDKVSTAKFSVPGHKGEKVIDMLITNDIPDIYSGEYYQWRILPQVNRDGFELQIIPTKNRKSFWFNLIALNTRDLFLELRGTEILTIIKCWVNHIPQVSYVRLLDTSNLRYTKLLKSGKTFYESRGFEMISHDQCLYTNFVRNLHKFDFTIFNETNYLKTQAYFQYFPHLVHCIPNAEDVTMNNYIIRFEKTFKKHYLSQEDYLNEKEFNEIVTAFRGIEIFRKTGQFATIPHYPTESSGYATLQYPPKKKKLC